MKRASFSADPAQLKRLRGERSLDALVDDIEGVTGKRIAVTTLKNAERGKPIDWSTLLILARALGVQPHVIAPDVAPDTPPFWEQQWLPPIPISPGLFKAMVKAGIEDMEGHSDQAAKTYEGLKIRHSKELEAAGGNLRIFVGIQLATVLDNAEKHEDALRELQETGRAQGTDLHALDPRWQMALTYHMALARFHLGQREKAMELLSKLSEHKGEFAPAAKHQIGAILMDGCEVFRKGGKRVPGEDMRQAGEHLSHARALWKLDGNYREGYPCLRLATLEEWAGRPDKALCYLLDAVEVFARWGCTKYVKRTRSRIESLFRTGGGVRV